MFILKPKLYKLEAHYNKRAFVSLTHSGSQLKNRLTPFPVFAFSHKRFMLSRTVKKVSDLPITNADAKQIVAATLGMCKLITDPENVKQLALSAKTNTATFDLTKTMYNYITKDEFGGTATIKTNFASLFVSQNKFINYPYNYMSQIFCGTKKILFQESLLLTPTLAAPVRTMIEFAILEQLAKNKNITNITYLGDRQTIPGRKNNPNRDYIVEFDTGKQVDMDVKTKKFDDSYLNGDIRRIDITQTEQIITIPRDYSNVFNQLKNLIEQTKNTLLFKNISLTPKDRQALDLELLHMTQQLNNYTSLSELSDNITNSSLIINSLSSWPYNLNLYPVYKIQNQELTPEAMTFLKARIQQIPQELLNKQSYMENWFIESLHEFEAINPKTAQLVKPLSKVFPFIKRYSLTYGKYEYDHFV